VGKWGINEGELRLGGQGRRGFKSPRQACLEIAEDGITQLGVSILVRRGERIALETGANIDDS
jgi:hypothetical protein